MQDQQLCSQNKIIALEKVFLKCGPETFFHGNYTHTVNDLFSTPVLVIAPYLISWQYSPMTASIMQRTCSSHPEKKNI